jgi:hypothetical protein
MHQRIWQFRLHDENVIDCASYFGKRATEVAAALNCQLVASNVVKIEHLRGNVRKIIGTALLENAKGNVFQFRQHRNGVDSGG